jgi:hypothetical protein
MKKSMFRWFLFLMLLCIPLIVSAQGQRNYNNKNGDWNRNQPQNYNNQTGWNVKGTVTSVDYGGHEVRIRSDQSSSYTVYAANAAIYEGNNKRDINSLHRGDKVVVFGREMRSNVVEAKAIYEIVNDSNNNYYDQNARNAHATGTIRGINTRNNQISISGDRKYDTVVLDSATKIYAKSGRRLSLNQLNQGDDIKVAGGEIRNDTIHAVDIYISINGSIYNPSGYTDNNYDRDQANISLTAVITSLNSSNGRIKIRSNRNYDTIIANSNTKIYNRNDRGTSLRNLEQGDTIKIKGYANRNNEITATEIRQQ